MTEKYFFEIGVYSLDEDSFYKEYETRKRKYFEWFFQYSGRIAPDRIPSSFAWAEQHLFEKYGCWPCNQAIGWIRLYVMGEQIRGEYYFVDAKRIRLLMKRKFSWHGNAFELHVSPEDSSAKIASDLETELRRLAKEKPFRGRHIDLEALMEIAPFIEWRQLIGQNQPSYHWGLSQ